MIYDITSSTMVDYPNHLACVVWVSGCNCDCYYCHNHYMIKEEERVSDADFYSFLESRQGLLDAVVFSGGECTISPKIGAYIKKAKKLGYKVKIDTNGSNPDFIDKYNEYIDYLAIDFKATKQTMKSVVGVDIHEETLKTIKKAMEYGLDFEVRTTVFKSLLNEKNINSIIKSLKVLGYQGVYYIQQGVVTEDMNYEVFDDEWIDTSKISKEIKVEFRESPIHNDA